MSAGHDETHFTKILPHMQHIQQHLFSFPLSHQNFKFTLHDHIKMFAGIAFMKENVTVFHFFHIQHGKDMIQFLVWKVGKQGNF